MERPISAFSKLQHIAENNGQWALVIVIVVAAVVDVDTAVVDVATAVVDVATAIDDFATAVLLLLMLCFVVISPYLRNTIN